MNKEIKIKKLWVHVGLGKRFGFGFSIDKYCVSFDFLCFWFSIEL